MNHFELQEKSEIFVFEIKFQEGKNQFFGKHISVWA